MKSLVRKGFFFVIGILVVVLILFTFLQNRLLFYPDKHLIADPARLGLDFENVAFQASDGVRLHGWYLPPHGDFSKPLAYLIFLHGNAGNISHRLDNLDGLVRAGLAVFIIDYRGYGLSEGRPDEKGLYLDAEAAYQYMMDRPDVEPSKLVVFGRSLGGAVAVELAQNHPPAALILESTFTSIRDAAAVHFPIVPSGLIFQAFESIDKIGRIAAPTLVIHGGRDNVVPETMGRRLFDAHPGPKDYYFIPWAGHNDTYLLDQSEYYGRLTSFIQAHVRQPNSS